MYVTFKLAYVHISEKRLPRMHPDVLPQTRRDSTLIADLEEFHLKSLHQLIMRPFLAMTKTSGIPMVTLKFIDIPRDMVLGETRL